MSNIVDIAHPDLILPGTPEDDEVNGPLDPCPSCGSRPHEAPEGVHDVHSVKHHPGAAVDDAKWNFEHCWRCGFRPGHNVAISAGEMRRQFAAFKQWLESQLPSQSDRGIAPPADNSEAEQLRAALAAAQEREAALRQQLQGGNDSGSSSS